MAMWFLQDSVVNSISGEAMALEVPPDPAKWSNEGQSSGRVGRSRGPATAGDAAADRLDASHPGGDARSQGCGCGGDGLASSVSTSRRRGRAAGRSARVSLPHGPGWLRCNSGVGALLGVGRCADFRSRAHVSVTEWADSRRVGPST